MARGALRPRVVALDVGPQRAEHGGGVDAHPLHRVALVGDVAPHVEAGVAEDAEHRPHAAVGVPRRIGHTLPDHDASHARVASVCCPWW